MRKLIDLIDLIVDITGLRAAQQREGECLAVNEPFCRETGCFNAFLSAMLGRTGHGRSVGQEPVSVGRNKQRHT